MCLAAEVPCSWLVRLELHCRGRLFVACSHLFRYVVFIRQSISTTNPPLGDRRQELYKIIGFYRILSVYLDSPRDSVKIYAKNKPIRLFSSQNYICFMIFSKFLSYISYSCLIYPILVLYVVFLSYISYSCLIYLRLVKSSEA